MNDIFEKIKKNIKNVSKRSKNLHLNFFFKKTQSIEMSQSQ